MRKFFAGALLTFLATPALAEQPSYDYFQLTWQTVEFDDNFFDIDGDGLGLSGSFEIGDEWHIIAGYSELGLDFGVDLTEFVVGGGWHTELSTNTSLFANLAWVSVDADTGPFGSFDDSGIGASVGLRSNVTDKVELQGSISYVDLDDAGDGTSFGVGAWYRVSDAFSLGLLGSFEDDTTAWGISGRLFF